MRKLRKDPDPKLKDIWGPFSLTFHVDTDRMEIRKYRQP